MTINFALSLSFEGIELLHRVQSGWRRIGHADIASDTLDADLAELRQKAEALDPDGFATKLIIPADQIRYLAIDSTQTTQDDIDAALDGATPYALSDLVVDFERSGGRTHIAAVARDTLTEAEAFASAHGFDPVAFVAIPEPFTFQKEVFFGPTTVMPDVLGANALVAADTRPVIIAGTRLKSRLLVMDAADAPDDNVADFLRAADQGDAAATLQPVTVPAAAPQQQGWIDRVPPEVYPAPAIAATVTVPQPATPVFAKAVIFDRIIAEVHAPRKPTPPVAAPVAISTPLRNVKTGPKAPARKAVEPAPRSGAPAKPFLIAASIALAVAGGVIFTKFQASHAAPTQTVQSNVDDSAPPSPVASAAPAQLPQPVLQAGPSIPDFDLPVLADTPATGTAPAPLGTSTPPVFSSAPPLVAMPAGDTAPTTPQDTVAPTDNVTLAQQADAPDLPGIVPSPAEAEQFYNATGVWQRAPRLIDTPSGAAVLGFARPASSATFTPPAPPRIDIPARPQAETVMPVPVNPPPADAVFARDARGFVQATPEGVITPDGAVVFAGLPDIVVNLRPTLTQEQLARMQSLAPLPNGVVVISGRPDVVPPLRPDNLVIAETTANDPTPEATRPTPGSVGLAALELQDNGALALDTSVVEGLSGDDLRPRLRPENLADASATNTPDITNILQGIAAEDATLRFENSTVLAVRASIRPNRRPANFETVIAAAQPPERAAPEQQTAAAPVAVAASVAPQNYAPVPGGVARAATQEDVIRLRDINLIGVYGRQNARRALVRLPNGSYVRVEVGSALDGGQVTAIGDTALNYVKRGRTYAVEMPSG